MFCCVATNHVRPFHGSFMESPEITTHAPHTHTNTHTHSRSSLVFLSLPPPFTHMQDSCRANQKMSLIFLSPQMLMMVHSNTYTTHCQFFILALLFWTRCHICLQLFSWAFFRVQLNSHVVLKRKKKDMKTAVATYFSH